MKALSLSTDKARMSTMVPVFFSCLCRSAPPPLSLDQALTIRISNGFIGAYGNLNLVW
jgi:hypothetical protein